MQATLDATTIRCASRIGAVKLAAAQGPHYSLASQIACIVLSTEHSAHQRLLCFSFAFNLVSDPLKRVAEQRVKPPTATNQCGLQRSEVDGNLHDELETLVPPTTLVSYAIERRAVEDVCHVPARITSEVWHLQGEQPLTVSD